jgi:hypothetical protein
MRSDAIMLLRVSLLAGVVLLGPMMPIAGAQTASVIEAALFPPALEPPVVLGDDGRAEVLVSEAILLLVSLLGCGVLISGLEALEVQRERRAERNAAHASIPGVRQRGTLFTAEEPWLVRRWPADLSAGGRGSNWATEPR